MKNNAQAPPGSRYSRRRVAVVPVISDSLLVSLFDCVIDCLVRSDCPLSPPVSSFVMQVYM